MQSGPIVEGIEAVMKFCNDFRSPETIKQYSKACDVILAFYKEHQQTFYDADVNNQIRKATDANHPLRRTQGFDGAVLDDDTLKMLYGLKQMTKSYSDSFACID